MKHIILCLMLLVPLFAWADAVIVSFPGASPIAVSGTDKRLQIVQEPDVAMLAERVSVDFTRDALWRVVCTFQFKSYAKTRISRTMAFPMDHYEGMGNVKDEFAVKVNGVDTPLDFHRNTPQLRNNWPVDPEFPEYAGFVTWLVSWKPGETKTVTCKMNNMRSQAFYSSLAHGERFRYIVRTGAFWLGPIGKADITFTFSDDPRKLIWKSQPSTQTFITYPEQAKWESPSKVHWNFENWEPTADIDLNVLTWVGIDDDYRFEVPDPYQGATIRYDDAMLDRLVQREIQPWEQFFPTETKAFDQNALKTHIAEALYYEIFARHNDPFLECNGNPSVKIGILIVGFREYVGKRMCYFYRRHGWYQPDAEKGTVSLDELNVTEKANLRFLRDIFKTPDDLHPGP